MKTPADLPGTAFRLAKALAAAGGTGLTQFFTEALGKRLRSSTVEICNTESPWMAGFGALSDLSEENRHVLGLIEQEFEKRVS